MTSSAPTQIQGSELIGPPRSLYHPKTVEICAVPKVQGLHGTGHQFAKQEFLQGASTDGTETRDLDPEQ